MLEVIVEDTASISIHAPARGATRRSQQHCASCAYFNPRSREGSDQDAQFWLDGQVIFQSTLPRGERLICSCSVSDSGIFQSTLPRGERHCTLAISSAAYSISIHAPARGATVMVMSNSATFLFQSTLPRGERL